MFVTYKGSRMSDNVLYFHKGVCESPFAAMIVDLHATGMATLAVWMEGQWRTKHSCFHRDSQKHIDNPGFAFNHGMWLSADDFEAEELLKAEEKAKAAEKALKEASAA